MTFKDDDHKRTRGRDGKLYNSRKQADRGYRAHENRAQTAARRTKWRAKGLWGRLTALVMTLIRLLTVRPLGFLGRCLSGGWNRLRGKKGNKKKRLKRRRRG